jgi:hypothetical protein
MLATELYHTHLIDMWYLRSRFQTGTINRPAHAQFILQTEGEGRGGVVCAQMVPKESTAVMRVSVWIRNEISLHEAIIILLRMHVDQSCMSTCQTSKSAACAHAFQRKSHFGTGI